MACLKLVTVLIATICIFGELAGGQIFSLENWMYRGMFHTEEEIKLLMDRAALYRKKLLMQQSRLPDTFFLLPGDGGACCITDVVYVPTLTLTNVLGELKYLVVLYDSNNQPLYQYFPQGLCIAKNVNYTDKAIKSYCSTDSKDSYGIIVTTKK